MLNRILKSLIKETKYSILLLGPRQTGKTTLIRSLKPDLSINFADEAEFLAFTRNPTELRERLGHLRSRSIVFIDEIQRIPSLLNTIQAIIDEKGSLDYRFLITGSSARKLRRGQANLLPGRVIALELGPLTLMEIGQAPGAISRALKWGTLPGIWTEENDLAKEQLLRTYGSTYLREEIQAEALTKNIEGFSRFLHVAAACNGQVLDLTKLASQAGVPRQTAVRFFEILEDTLIVHRCDAYSGSTRQRLLKHPKFYFFDVGVLNGVLGNFGASEDRKGMLFESFVFNQIKASAQALGKNISIATFRTSNQAEVDFIVEWNQETWAIEVKASSNVAESDLRGIRTFQSSVKRPTRACVIIPEGAPRVIDQIPVLPLYQALNEIGLAP